MMTISTHWKVDKTFCHCSRCLNQPNGIDFKGYLVSSDLTSSTAHACHMFPWCWVLSCIHGYKIYMCDNLQNCCWYFKKLSWKWIPDLKMNTWLENKYLTWWWIPDTHISLGAGMWSSQRYHGPRSAKLFHLHDMAVVEGFCLRCMNWDILK